MPQVAQQQPPFGILAKIAVIWLLSDIGFYILLALIGNGSGYSNDPVEMAGYYLLWVGIALVTFWALYKGWRMVKVDVSMFGIIALMVALIACYLLFVFPLFPAIQWTPLLEPPSELPSASQWYFLPKSIEIMLQQLLVVAMVLAFDARKYTLREISDWSAVLFGGAHLLLVFGLSFSYMVVFTLVATAAGFIFPYLLLRVRNGFLYAYTLHWTFYAVIITLIRILYVH